VIAYLDASVVLRILLREENPLAEWNDIDVALTSELTRVETARVIDRLAVLEVLQDQEIEETHAEVADLFRRIDFIRIDDAVLSRASEPLPTVLGTLDAIHLASASMYRDAQPDDKPPIVVATHDRALGAAARALRFRVIGA
jgi:predicted nucleic acid-binding protein